MGATGLLLALGPREGRPLEMPTCDWLPSYGLDENDPLVAPRRVQLQHEKNHVRQCKQHYCQFYPITERQKVHLQTAKRSQGSRRSGSRRPEVQYIRFLTCAEYSKRQIGRWSSLFQTMCSFDAVVPAEVCQKQRALCPRHGYLSSPMQVLHASSVDRQSTRLRVTKLPFHFYNSLPSFTQLQDPGG